jgi:predicted MFS family arabinose efflux permease
MVLAGGLVMGLGFLGWYATPFAWPVAPIALLVGFGTYLFHNTLQTHATQMAPAIRGSAMALFAFFFFTGQAIGVWLAGHAYDHAGALPLLVVPALVLPAIAAGFAHALKRRSAA